MYVRLREDVECMRTFASTRTLTKTATWIEDSEHRIARSRAERAGSSFYLYPRRKTASICTRTTRMAMSLRTSSSVQPRKLSAMSPSGPYPATPSTSMMSMTSNSSDTSSSPSRSSSTNFSPCTSASTSTSRSTSTSASTSASTSTSTASSNRRLSVDIAAHEIPCTAWEAQLYFLMGFKVGVGDAGRSGVVGLG